jgi:beta-galactosidase
MTRTTPRTLGRCLTLLALLAGASSALAADRVTLNFNPDWRFIKADPAGASGERFDDRAWSLVSAPHTFNDVDTFDNWSTPGHRGEQIQWGGRTWYRKTFRLPDAYRGRRVFIEFEGVRQVAEVYLNGTRLGISKTGFTPFGFDLTPYVRFGSEVNVLAVMCDNRFMTDPLDAAAAAALGTATRGGQSTPNPNLAQLSARVNETIPDSLDELRADQIPWNNPHWHPAHGGIYRNVRLHVTDPLHITLPLYSFLQTAGPYAYATDLSTGAATVHVDVPLVNGRPSAALATARVEIRDASGRTVLTVERQLSVAAGASASVELSGVVARPRFWEPGYPHLYRVTCSLMAGGSPIDTVDVPLGIRAVLWDAARGLFLNGQPLKLRGWGQKPTNEWPGLGAALPDWLHAYTLQLMKEAGANFVRWGHTAAGPAQISASDRLGLITDQPGVDGESDTRGAAWALRVSAFRDVVVYYRNNPSILIWEGGNQKVSREHARELRAIMDRYDPHGGRAYAHRRADQITAEVMDVGIGTEGGREIAALPVVEGEYNREESPRRVWDDASPPRFGYPEAKGQTYQLTSEQFAVNQVAHFVKKLGAPEHSGGANWIFSDSTSGGRVAVEVARASGEVDATRLPKEAYYAVAAMFRSDPRVHIIGHWTYPAGTTKSVFVVSNADDVELFVNGASVGRARPTDRFLFSFPGIAWKPGEITAVASTGGRVVATQTKRTAGAAVALKITPITAPGGLRADGADVALFDVEAVDAEGERCPTVEARVDFQVGGPGVWRGGYNSGKTDSINHPFLDLEAGIARVAVRATRTPGTISVTAASAGLRAATARVASIAFPAEAGQTTTMPAVEAVVLPPVAPARTLQAAGPAAPGAAGGGVDRGMVGRFTKAFNYSGPSSYIVHVESQARDGKNPYVDADAQFAGLPAGLAGADWVQAASRESQYQAVDLMELRVAAGSVVTLAHDDRLSRPGWLLRLFQPSQGAIVVAGQRMTLFTRSVTEEESLTLGANDEAAGPAANMYIVFIAAK